MLDSRINTAFVTKDQMIDELQRELDKRKEVYKTLVRRGGMKKSDANNQYLALLAALRHIKEEPQRVTAIQGSVFDQP